MGHRAAAALLHGQAWLGPVKRLNLALFIDRQDDGMLWWIDVKPNDIQQFGGEPGIVGQLELAYPMRLQTMLAPDALHRTDADADVPGHRRRGPVRGLAGRCGLCRGDHTRLDLGSERWNARRTGLVAEQARHTFDHEPFLPPPHACLARTGAAGDFHRAAAVRAEQHDLGPPDVLLRAVPVRHNGRQSLAVGVGHVDYDTFAHPPDSHGRVSVRIPNRMQASDYIH